MTDEKSFAAISSMLRLCRIHRCLIEAKVGEMGIPSTAHRALMYISKKGRLEAQKELASHLQITPAAVTGVLQRLEADGYIERTLGSDNRFNEIAITEKGKSTVSVSRGLFRDIDASMFKDLSGEELDVFIGLLEKIRKNAEEKLHQSDE